ncbi:MAG: hypothetical protein ACT4N8_07810 [Sphingosinicella sp.]|uniref:hypothetical protein n=1 Tax=Sphingosinicella sp. TaxID=1917971 RepID=UPI0040382309
MCALASLLLCALTFAAPAQARNWVRISDGWFDRDSIRRAGDLVHFDVVGILETEAGAAPAILPDQPGIDEIGADEEYVQARAYSCRSRVLSIVLENGRIEPVWNRELEGNEAAAFTRLLCRRPR